MERYTNSDERANNNSLMSCSVDLKCTHEKRAYFISPNRLNNGKQSLNFHQRSIINRNIYRYSEIMSSIAFGLSSDKGSAFELRTRGILLISTFMLKYKASESINTGLDMLQQNKQYISRVKIDHFHIYPMSCHKKLHLDARAR